MRISDRNELMMFGVIVAGKALFVVDCRAATGSVRAHNCHPPNRLFTSLLTSAWRALPPKP
jgi:hypothetical protein